MSTDALLNANFKTQPWGHQWREFEEAADLPARAWLWQMRSGKSKMTIDNACHLYLHGGVNGKIDCLLLFAPNGVHENWVVRELPAHLWDGVPTRPMYWRTRVAGAKGGNRLSKADRARWEAERTEWWQGFKDALDSPDLMVISFNSESVQRDDVKKALSTLVKRRRCMAVWDEASDYRTPGSKRTKMMRALARRVPYRRILDGTLSHNSPLHVFSPYELLEKGALGYSRFDGFKDRYAIYENTRGAGGRVFPKLVGFKNLDKLKEAMAPYTSVVLREDCVDLPPLVPRPRLFEMSDQQLEAYRTMTLDAMAEVSGQDIELNEQVNRILKLQQIASGFIIDKFRKVHHIPGPTPRLDALEDEVYLAPGKVIVWCAFHEDMDAVIERLRKLDIGDVVEYSGRVSPEDKMDARTRFQQDKAVHALVGHPAAGGRGIELSAASHVIWYSHTFNAIHRAQADERATKMGGGNITVVDIQAKGVDQYILGALAKKVDIADDVAGRGLKAVLQEVSV